eukprot:TRINITY_DN12124_c0_g1::TRINITY_DN12124_c0_g1_i1::g.26569::m.26569 TRINITY_DN12124_c0_g1::TRINITY_DN12124_c0_g1_i1::g.26569  ORF type:complete len:342 (-),score=57.07,sp/Q8CG45/ARK72_RAT/50.00/4e-108,Aldo_ket_red/PF00248.16/9.8e-51 TRINITY_DN12124_c0_g1_i1:185-1150(-)
MSKLRVILGTMGMGTKMNVEQSAESIKKFREFGHVEIDTALMYGAGNTEKVLAAALASPGLSDYSVQIATKANPWVERALKPESVKEQLTTSLHSLQRNSVDIFYLHAPDHNTEIADTLRAVNELYQAGKFKEFGLSNYAAWQVAEIYYLCKEHGFVLPTVYQGMYNGVTRDVERELFPCIRRLGLRFYAYNPLAGGILTGRYQYEAVPDEGRFGGEDKWAKAYRDRYWKKEIFSGMERLRTACEASGQVTLMDSAFSWLVHHSKLDATKGDGVIIGGSSVQQIATNLEALRKAVPLPDSVVSAYDQTWQEAKPNVPSYFR